MNVLFGQMNKEINSTKRMAREDFAISLDMQLKDNCSVTSPILTIRKDRFDVDPDHHYNYAYISRWQRYYFVVNYVMTPGGIWEIYLAIDVLATWKWYIQNSTAYVRRSASNYSMFLPDPTWSHSSDFTQTSHVIDVGLSAPGGGTVLLFTATDDQSTAAEAMPGMSCYAMSLSVLRNLCNYLFSNDFWSVIETDINDDVSAQMCKTFFNPFQYLLKCMWFPVSQSSFTGSIVPIGFGWWEAAAIGGNISATLVNIHKLKKTFTFTLGNYANWTSRDNDWNRYTLYVPGFGQLNISAEYAGYTLTGEIIIDLSTGEAGLFIKSGDALIQSATGKIGASIQLSSLYEDLIQDFGSKSAAMQNVVRAGAGGIMGAVQARGAIKEQVKNMFTMSAGDYTEWRLANGNGQEIAESIVKGAQSALQPTLSTIGSTSTRAIVEEEGNAILTHTYYSRYEDIHQRLGGMCNKVLSLENLSGYTEIVNPHIQCPATAEEITQINTFLTGGFFLE